MTLSLTFGSRDSPPPQLISPLFPPSAGADATACWSPGQQAWARGHRPGSFFPKGSQGPRRRRTPEILASGATRRGPPGVSPAGLHRQQAPGSGPQRLGRDAPEAAQSPQRRHLAPPRTAGRRTGGSASRAPPGGFPRTGATGPPSWQLAGPRPPRADSIRVPRRGSALALGAAAAHGARRSWRTRRGGSRSKSRLPRGPALAGPRASPPPARAALRVAASEPGPPGTASPRLCQKIGSGESQLISRWPERARERGPERGGAGLRAPAKPKRKRSTPRPPALERAAGCGAAASAQMGRGGPLWVTLMSARFPEATEAPLEMFHSLLPAWVKSSFPSCLSDPGQWHGMGTPCLQESDPNSAWKRPRVLQLWRLVPARSLCLPAQLQLGHPLSLHRPPTLSLERGRSPDSPPPTGSLRQPTSSAAGWGRQTTKVAETGNS